LAVRTLFENDRYGVADEFVDLFETVGRGSLLMDSGPAYCA